MNDIPEENLDSLREMPSQKRLTLTWVKMLTGLGIIVVLGCLILPCPRRVRESTRRVESRNHLKQIGRALYSYHDTFRQLPVGTVSNPDLNPDARLSWIVSALPFLDQAPLYGEIDQSKGWQDPLNAVHTKSYMYVLVNPTNSSVTPPDGFAVTNYVGIGGIGTDAAILPLSDKRVGAFGYDRNVRLEDVTDGLATTMFVTDASKEFGRWSQGGTATIRALTTKPYINGPDGIGSPHVGIIQVLLGDGSVRAVTENIDPSVFEALATIHGGEIVGDF